jgi:16S rRNA (adenine1518-N6/adenine1519-N6)-dimethyltransferase
MENKRFAKKSLGQNYLVDAPVIDRIVAALEIEPDETIIEIGPGRGALTERLVESGANVIAIELDRVLVPMLREKFASNDNFSVIEADANVVNFSELCPHKDKSVRVPMKLVANLPYYISTAILQRLIEQRNVFSRMVLMFQKEVVERITAPPGNSDRGFLTVLVEAYLVAEKLFDVPPTAFRPIPKVHSSVIKLVPHDCRSPHDSKGEIDGSEFRSLVSAAFAQKRKTILNNLKHVYPNAAELLQKAAIDPSRRAETLTTEEWKRLSAFHTH